MKSKKLLMLLIAVISIAAAMCVFVACGDDDGNDKVKTYTVSFDTDGAGTIAPVLVKDGETAEEPPEPQKDNWVFKGWFIGETEYDFSSPVKSELTLKAKWNELYTVAFMSDGSVFKTRTAEKGTAVSMSDVPVKADNIFVYWRESEEEGGAQYDLSAPVTDNLTLHAEWISEERADKMLQRALDGQRFTSYPYAAAFTVSEVSDGETLEYTITYKLFENGEGGHDVYSVFDSSWSTEARYTVFGADGKELCRYYKGNNDSEFKVSQSVWGYEYYMPFRFGEMNANLATGDFACVDGDIFRDGAYVFHVYDEKIANFEYSMMGTVRGMLVQTAVLSVKDDKLVKVQGKLQNGCDYEVRFDYTDFTQSRPTLPQSEVAARKIKDGSGVVGAAISISDIAALFELKVNGNSVKITEDMLDLGELNIQNPAAGVYPVRLSYTSWDGATASAEATVTVAAQTLENALGGKKYLNSSFTVGSTAIKRNGDVYFYEDSTSGYYLKLDSSSQGYKTAKMAKTTKKVTLSPWVRCLRIDLLLGFAADLFEYDDTAKTYTLTADYGNKPYGTELQRFFALTNTTNTSYALVNIKNSAKPYSLVVTVNDSKEITKVAVSFYTTKQLAFEFAVVADAESAEVPHEVVNALTQYAVTYKPGDKAEGEDKEVSQGGGAYSVLQFSEYSFAWTVREGWKFVNWIIEGTDTQVNGGTSYTLDDMDNPKVTFVAQWEEKEKYTVTYKAGDNGTGADVVENNVYEGAYVLKGIDSLTIEANDGYVLAGWLVEGSSASLAAGATYNIASDVVFVAQWKREFTSGDVYKQAQDGKQEAKFYDGYAYIVIDEAEIDLIALQIKLTYTSGGTTETAILDLQEDKYYGQDYELKADGALKNYFANGVFIKLSADGNSLQFSEYDDYDEITVDTGSAFIKQA